MTSNAIIVANLCLPSLQESLCLVHLEGLLAPGNQALPESKNTINNLHAVIISVDHKHAAIHSSRGTKTLSALHLKQRNLVTPMDST